MPLRAAGGFTPIGYHIPPIPNLKKLRRHIRSIARRLFDRLGPFFWNRRENEPVITFYSGFAPPPIVYYYYEVPEGCYQRPPPQAHTRRAFSHILHSFFNSLLRTLLVASLLLPFASVETTSRLADKNAFYTQNLGDKVDRTINLGKNTTLTIYGSTRFYNIFINKIKVEQKFDYEIGKENKVDLFEQNTNLKFTAYLSIGKDTVLKLVSDPNCKLCAIDTLVLKPGKTTITNKKGEIIEENLETVLSVKKEGKFYKVTFGLEKDFNSPEDAYTLFNLVLSYGEVYERHLNAIVGEFKKQKIDFLAFKGKMNGLYEIFEPASAEEYLYSYFYNAPELNYYYEGGYGDMLINENFIESHGWVEIANFYNTSTPLVQPAEGFIRVGEQYNNLANELVDHYRDETKRQYVSDMAYARYKNKDPRIHLKDTSDWWVRANVSLHILGPGFI